MAQVDLELSFDSNRIGNKKNFNEHNQRTYRIC